MSDVFISYKAEDRRRIQPLVQALQADGLSVWWDEHIGAGDSWRETIERQLEEAKCVIVVWSKRSAGPEGRFVREEASRAQRRSIYVPVLIDAVEPPLGFGESQATSLRGWHGDRADPHYQAVLAAVHRITGVKPGSAAPPSHHAPALVTRRTAIAGGAVAAVAVAGIGAWEVLKPSSASAEGTIAVLPFTNLSGDPNQTYFSDGVAEEIRSSLGRIAGLKVAGSTSSEAVRNDDAETAAKKLGVANILTGSVRSSPSTIRVSAELIDGGTGLDKWSQDYDRQPGDAIKIQTDIAENVASALSAALGVAAKAAVAIGGTQNPQAQRLYLQAKALGKGAYSQGALEQGLQLLDAAIALDPNYADAYAAKSGTLGAYTNAFAKGAADIARDRSEQLSLAQTAVRLAPKLAAAHRAMGGAYIGLLQIGRSVHELTLARQLAPSDSDTLISYAHALSALGRPFEAIALADQAVAMDPLNPAPYSARLYFLFCARRFPEAVSYGQQILRKLQSYSRSLTIADSLVMLGRYPEAQSYYAQAPANYWQRLTGEAIIRARTGDRAGAQAKLAELQQEFADAASSQYAEIYAQLGDKDRAFASLNRGFDVKDVGVTLILTDPFLDPIRSDPRFAALLQKMDFPSA